MQVSHPHNPWRGKEVDVSISHLVFMVLAAMLYAGLLLGCQASVEYPVSQISIASLCVLTPEQIAQMDQAQVRQWLANQYGVVPTFSMIDGITSITFAPEDKGGATIFLNGERILNAYHGIKDGPTFGRIVTVFGEPKSVYGMGQTKEVILISTGMDYPNLGISVFANKEISSQEAEHEVHQEVQLKEDDVVDLVECYQPRASMD